VGAKETTDDGAPCHCFEYDQQNAHAHADSGGTDVMPAQTAIKVCCRCGKDLSGKKRLKDSLGYWCPECAKDDAKAKEDKGTPCAKCHRKVPEQSMTSVDGKLVCTRCMREERELRAPGSKKFRPISDKSYKQDEKRNIIIMAAIAFVLLIFMIIAWFRFPSFH
jgi:DNA-directed RNA polymerase subunit RPC12/RpoP